MGEQRRRQHHRHHARWGGRARALALALSLPLGLGCTGERALLDPGNGPGGGGRAADPNPVVGEWEVTLVVFVPDRFNPVDVQTWTTNWVFDEDGACRFLQTVQSALDGTTFVETRGCTWSTANGRLRVVYDDTGGVTESSYSFPGGDTSRLLFEEVEYRRIER